MFGVSLRFRPVAGALDKLLKLSPSHLVLSHRKGLVEFYPLKVATTDLLVGAVLKPPARDLHHFRGQAAGPQGIARQGLGCGLSLPLHLVVVFLLKQFRPPSLVLDPAVLCLDLLELLLSGIEQPQRVPVVLSLPSHQRQILLHRFQRGLDLSRRKRDLSVLEMKLVRQGDPVFLLQIEGLLEGFQCPIVIPLSLPFLGLQKIPVDQDLRWKLGDHRDGSCQQEDNDSLEDSHHRDLILLDTG